MSPDLTHVGAWGLLRMYAEESSRKSSAPAIDVSQPMVDGTPQHDGLNYLGDLVLLTKHVPRAALDIVCILVLEVRCNSRGAVVEEIRDGEAYPKPADFKQAARQFSAEEMRHGRPHITASVAKRIVAKACRQVEHNMAERERLRAGRL